jgi:hypothetical protein
MSLVKSSFTDAQRDAIIAQALETPEGRVALAQAMIEPIKRALEYQAIGRKLLMVDELPQGALARYERDVASVAYVISRRGAVPDRITEGEEVLVPTFEIAVNPQIRLSEIKARRFYIVDRAQMKAKEAIQKAEDTEILSDIDAAVRTNQTVTQSGDLTIGSLNYAFSTVESHDLTVAKIVMHPRQYADVRLFGRDVYDEATRRDVLMSGLFGHLWTADIHVSHRVPEGKVFILAPAEYVGAIPVRQDITVIPADNPKELRIGWVIYEEIGIIVINDYAIARIDLTSTS